MPVHQPNAATLTSMVQAAPLLPVLFLSLPAGVLADVLDVLVTSVVDTGLVLNMAKTSGVVGAV